MLLTKENEITLDIYSLVRDSSGEKLSSVINIKLQKCQYIHMAIGEDIQFKSTSCNNEIKKRTTISLTLQWKFMMMIEKIGTI